MADLCFICDKSLAEGESVNVVRGLQTLKTASIARSDGHIDYLNTLTSVNVHTVCRKVYISKNSIAASKRRLEEGEPSTSSSESRNKRNVLFDFKKLCLFCGQAADEVAEKKKKEKYRRTISKVSTLEFKDSVLEKAEKRKDTIGGLVKDRILYEYDLIAAEAKYHTNCYVIFLKQVSYADRNPRLDDKATRAMREIFSYIENNEDSQFTLKELKNILTEYVPDDKTIITKLQQKYQTDIIIKKKSEESQDTGLWTPKEEIDHVESPSTFQLESHFNQQSDTQSTAASTPLSQITRKRPLANEERLEDPYEDLYMRKSRTRLDEFDIYGQYVGSELRQVKDEYSVLMAKNYINKILIDARLGKYRADGCSERHTPAKRTIKQEPSCHNSPVQCQESLEVLVSDMDSPNLH